MHFWQIVVAKPCSCARGRLIAGALWGNHTFGHQSGPQGASAPGCRPSKVLSAQEACPRDYHYRWRAYWRVQGYSALRHHQRQAWSAEWPIGPRRCRIPVCSGMHTNTLHPLVSLQVLEAGSQTVRCCACQELQVCERASDVHQYLDQASLRDPEYCARSARMSAPRGSLLPWTRTQKLARLSTAPATMRTRARSSSESRRQSNILLNLLQESRQNNALAV